MPEERKAPETAIPGHLRRAVKMRHQACTASGSQAAAQPPTSRSNSRTSPCRGATPPAGNQPVEAPDALHNRARRHRRPFHEQTQARRGYGVKMTHAGPTTQDSREMHQRRLLMQHPRYDKKEVNHAYLNCYHPDRGGCGNLTNPSGMRRQAGSAYHRPRQDFHHKRT